MIDKNSTLTIKQLEEYCELYDSHNGSFPEHMYEGDSVYSFIIEQIEKNNNIIININQIDN